MEEGTLPVPGEREAPLWENGEPANLSAAAADALLWLRWTERACRDYFCRCRGQVEGERLRRCVAALERFLSPEKGETDA